MTFGVSVVRGVLIRSAGLKVCSVKSISCFLSLALWGLRRLRLHALPSGLHMRRCALLSTWFRWMQWKDVMTTSEGTLSTRSSLVTYWQLASLESEDSQAINPILTKMAPSLSGWFLLGGGATGALFKARPCRKLGNFLQGSIQQNTRRTPGVLLFTYMVTKGVIKAGYSWQRKIMLLLNFSPLRLIQNRIGGSAVSPYMRWKFAGKLMWILEGFKISILPIEISILLFAHFEQVERPL